MNLRQRLIKNLLFFSILAYYLGGYFLINLFNRTRTVYFQLDLPHEAGIPFYPEFILGYMLLFGVIAYTYAGIQDLGFFKKTVKAFYISVTIHFIFFVLIPVEYHLRPMVDASLGGFYPVAHFYFWLDLPYNCFPSLHISNGFICAFILQRYRPGLGRIFFPLAALIAVSVVLVKQHYIVDVIGGLVVAYGVYWYVWRAERESAAAYVELPSRGSEEDRVYG